MLEENPNNLEENIRHLETALSDIASRSNNNFRDANFHLRKAGMIGQIKALVEVSFKRAIDWAIENIKDKEPPYFSSSLFMDKFGHTFYDGEEENLDTNYFKAVGKFAAKFQEAKKAYIKVADYYEVLGDHENLERIKKLISENRGELAAPYDLEMIERAAKEFLAEVENDPIRQINDDVIVEKVKKEIEQKLVELKAQ